tara:strand:- start:3535 stop:3762 length:228 start_codon:yes stop_codon:yes gene_type:complete
MLKADGLDKAVIGVGMRCGQEDILVYNYQMCVTILMARDKMSYEEAIDWMEYNVVGAWLGNQTPIFVRDLEEDEL